jgi:hypothetical protein
MTENSTEFNETEDAFATKKGLNVPVKLGPGLVFDGLTTPVEEEGQWGSARNVLTTQVEGSQSVGKVLERGVREQQRVGEEDPELKKLVERREWMSVGIVLEQGVGDTQRRWAVEEASKNAADPVFQYSILPHCSDDQLDSVLTILVKRGLWASVDKVLERGVSDKKLQWAVEWACTNTGDYILRSFILPHCHDDQLDSVLTTLVERGRWQVVGKVLKCGVSDDKRQWAVEEASKKANDGFFRSFILPHCSHAQLGLVLTTLVERGLWECVGKALERGVSDTQRQLAVEEAIKNADDWNLASFILPHCHDDRLDSVLPILVKRGLWQSVGRVLKLGVSDKKQQWAVEEASNNANDSRFTFYILPHCSDNQLDSMLTTLVERSLWKSVGKVLERSGVSDAKRQWAVEEASKKADDRKLEQYILPHCHDDQLDAVLTTLVERGLWDSVGNVLERGVSDEKRQWAVEEASKKANGRDFDCFILPHCSTDQLRSVLSNLKARDLHIYSACPLELKNR